MKPLGNALGDLLFFLMDKLTDKIADYIKYKDLENRLKL